MARQLDYRDFYDLMPSELRKTLLRVQDYRAAVPHLSLEKALRTALTATICERDGFDILSAEMSAQRCQVDRQATTTPGRGGTQIFKTPKNVERARTF